MFVVSQLPLLAFPFIQTSKVNWLLNTGSKYHPLIFGETPGFFLLDSLVKKEDETCEGYGFLNL
jgi:hypothetical protein